jgi:hypothetical protein
MGGRCVRLAWLFMAAVVVFHLACGPSPGRPALPESLADDEFWSLSSGLSEPAGVFPHSDNLVSNEILFVHLVRMLGPAGGVYIGVGPEQNFSYIARLQPSMAFVVDIRRENRNLLLMYKALFELSADRADFLSRLFSRERPADVDAQTRVADLFAHYARAAPSEQLFATNASLVREHLLTIHQFPLSDEDLHWIDYALRAFYSDGPDIRYGRLRASDEPGPSYRALMTVGDVSGHSQSYLASEERFAFVKRLFAANLIVPLVGDFGGLQALRRVGDYVRQHDKVVTAFYASNVEVYLNREKMAAYCGNLAALPHQARTWYIDSKAVQPFFSKLKACHSAIR